MLRQKFQAQKSDWYEPGNKLHAFVRKNREEKEYKNTTYLTKDFSFRGKEQISEARKFAIS